MKLTTLLFRNARQPQDPKKVPFKEIIPLSLKNYISSSQKAEDRGCLYEISLLLTCLEQNEYKDKSCSSQVQALDACYKRYQQTIKLQKIKSHQKVPVPDSKTYTNQQISYLLRRYPTV